MREGFLSRACRPVAAPVRPGRHPRRDELASRPTRPTSSARSGIDSRDGFEIGLELTAKARRLRLPVAEIPTIWLDRAQGSPNFKLAAWIPAYLRWYRFAFGRRLDVADELAGDERRSPTTRSSPA